MAPLWTQRAASTLRSPTLHFFAIGLLLFGVHAALHPPPPQRIVVSSDTEAGLLQDFRRRTGRPPSAVEAAALVDSYIDSEVLLREAQARHLDRGDVIIRRRLLQKMDWVIDALLPPEQAAVSDADLAAYLGGHADRYREPARLSLRHVFVAGDGTGAAQARAADLQAALLRGADPARLGDPFVRGAQFVAATPDELAALFGASWVAQVVTLPIGTWSAPLRSSYGLHIVRLTAHTPAQTPPLDRLRDRLRADLLAERLKDQRKALLQRLRQSYDVVDSRGGQRR